MPARMTYTPGDEAPEFRWHGGAYIEIGHSHDGEWAALDCINVWDYATDKPRIPRTLDAFQDRCDNWIAARDGWED